MPEMALLISIAAVTAMVGAISGLGGAIILVPSLVVLGWTAGEAAPLGMTSVAALSIAAGSRHLNQRFVNHRIGVTTELAAATGAVVGVLTSSLLPDDALVLFLAVVTLTAAALGVGRRGLRNPPMAGYGPEDVGERVGSLAGVYPIDGGIAPYRVQHLPLGLGLMGVAGLVAGATGTSGGFIKTPTTSEVMRVPTLVAASTTVFTIGVTASAALLIYLLQGRVDPQPTAAVVFGAIAGGSAGAALQARLSPTFVRRGSSLILMVIATLLIAAR